MDPNDNDKQATDPQPLDLDNAIDELEGLLTSHDSDRHQSSCSQEDEETIPVLLDVVEEANPVAMDYAFSAEDIAAEPASMGTADEEFERLLPFEFLDDVTPLDAAPEPGPDEPETALPAAMGDRQMAGRELTPQLLDELETIIDHELQRVTAEAKQSILAILKAHLDSSGHGDPDFDAPDPSEEHFPATGRKPEQFPRPDNGHTPLRPFDPFNDPE